MGKNERGGSTLMQAISNIKIGHIEMSYDITNKGGISEKRG